MANLLRRGREIYLDIDPEPPAVRRKSIHGTNHAPRLAPVLLRMASMILLTRLVVEEFVGTDEPGGRLPLSPEGLHV